jgi:DNA-binding PadR family transcriptional regulator
MFNDSEYHGYDINKHLAEESADVELSRLYRVLNDMENEGILKGHWEKNDRGPRKKVYSLGEKGIQEREKMLLEAIETVHAHYDQYIMGLPPEHSVFELIVNKLLEETPEEGNLGFITPVFASIHHRILLTINKKRPEATVYLISPHQIELDNQLQNIIQLDGFYNDIPLKEDFLAVLTIVGIPPVNLIDKCITEWKRSLASGGRLAILTPTVLVEKFHHPMPIGQFIENYEHTATRKQEFPNRESLEGLLRANFYEVISEKIIHVSTFFARND